MNAMSIDLAVAKSNKYASRESGDTAELVERPGGGASIVLADGQGSGRAAKSLSMMVTSKAVALLKEGVRDGAVARAVHDYLFAYRHGQVSATLDILSVDLHSRSVLVTRNAETPMLIRGGHEMEVVRSGSGPIGLYRLTKLAITERPLEVGVQVVLFSDGVTAGGRPPMPRFDLNQFATRPDLDKLSAADLADAVLHEVVRLDQGRLQDDTTVVALSIRPHQEDLLVRRLNARIPLPI